MIRLISLLLLPAAALADPVSIRSGEHETFSRLVITIGEGSEWSVSKVNGGYELNLDGPTEGFDTSTVFDRILQNRLRAVTQRDLDSLFLDVTCECYVDAFLWRPGQLVLDVVEGIDPDAAPVTTSNLEPQLQLPDLLTTRTQEPELLPSFAVPMEFQSQPRSSDLIEAEEALIAGLARAASQGFLNPAIQPVSEPSDVIITLDDDPVDLPGPPPIVGQPGVGISTASDRDLALLGDVLESAVGNQCLSEDLFQLSSWGNGEAFHVQFASLAEGLVGEFGQEPTEAREALARLYLHFGFGAEARSILSADPALSQSRQAFTELAGIIDDYPGAYPLIMSQSGCSTPAALWAFYVQPTSLEEDERNFILQQFFALPQPLRGHLAPQLSQKLVSVNQIETAERVLAAVDNNDAQSTHSTQSTRALIAQESDETDLAIEVLSTEASDNARMSPASLVQLIDLELKQGRIPRESDVELAASMRQEYRGSQISEDLTLAEARGRIALGQFKNAIELIEGKVGEDAIFVLNEAYRDLTTNAAANVFLEFGFGVLPEGLGPETENQIARRMIELGFPERAADLLVGQATQEAAAERRYLRAQAAIELGSFTTALDELLGMNDAVSRELRSRAYAGLGEHRSALEALGVDDDAAESDAHQFRAGAWERLTTEGDEVLSNFAQAVLAPDIAEPAVTLSQRRAILRQSQESRRAVEDLLLRFDGTTPSD